MFFILLVDNILKYVFHLVFLRNIQKITKIVLYDMDVENNSDVSKMLSEINSKISNDNKFREIEKS